MPPSATKTKPGCLTRIVRWGLAGLGVIFACAIIANFLPKSQTPAPPTAQADRAITISTSAPAATDPPTSTDVPLESGGFSSGPAATEISVPAVATNSLLPPPTSTDTPIPPANTPMPQPVANQDANLRGGPGTDYPVVGSIAAGERVGVVAMSPDGQWLELDTGAWVATFLISDFGSNLSVEANIPAPPAASSIDTPVPVVIEQPPAPPQATDTPWVPAVIAPGPQSSCCKICSKSKACGDSCIAQDKTCNVGAGCACNAN